VGLMELFSTSRTTHVARNIFQTYTNAMRTATGLVCTANRFETQWKIKGLNGAIGPPILAQR